MVTILGLDTTYGDAKMQIWIEARTVGVDSRYVCCLFRCISSTYTYLEVNEALLHPSRLDQYAHDEGTDTWGGGRRELFEGV